MNDDHQLEPPSAELQELFDAEAAFPDMPQSRQHRVRTALKGAIAVLPPFGGGGGGGAMADTGGLEGIADAAVASGSSAASGAAGTASAGAASAASAGAAAVGAAGLGGAKAIAVAVALYAGGVASGVGLQTAMTEEEETPPPIAAQLAPPPETPRVTRIEPPEPMPEGPAERVRPVVPTPAVEEPAPPERARPTRSASQLDAERAVIDVARAAIAHGHVTSALAAVRRHRREFPRGELEEERESLWIIALAKGDRRSEARRRALRFHRRFPRSALRRAVDLALAE